MAKGIIAGRPGSGNPNGRIMVTDGSDMKPEVLPGTVLKYDEINKSNDGDLVTFVIDPATGMPSKMVSDATGTVYTGNINQDITVGAGQSVLLSAANFEGTIINNGGYLTIVNQSTISGKIQSVTTDAYVFLNGSSFEGKLESSNGGYLSVANCNLTGKVTSNGNKYVAIQNCTITGKSEVINAVTSNCSGNTLNGNPITGCGK